MEAERAIGPSGPEALVPARIDRDELRLLSWNVFRNARPARIAATLERLLGTHDPDLILIQEAPAYAARGFADLALFTGYQAFYAPAHRVLRGRLGSAPQSTGQLILSRYAFREQAVHELPVLPARAGSGTVRRNALYARFALAAGGTLGVYNVHLENRSGPAGRSKQVRHLLEVVREKNDRIVVVGGDFNTFFPSAFESALRLFAEAGFTNLFGAGERRLLPRLDYVLVRGDVSARGLPLKGGGSDHRPLLASVRL